jgi:hypothetical protein
MATACDNYISRRNNSGEAMELKLCNKKEYYKRDYVISVEA